MATFHFQIPVPSFFDCLGNITQLIFLPPLNVFSASQIFPFLDFGLGLHYRVYKLQLGRGIKAQN